MATTSRFQKKPEWLKIKAPSGKSYQDIAKMLREKKLATVCQEALCPNINECWNGGTATIMLLGDTCTRGCRFCAVNSGNPKGVLDEMEPFNTAETIKTMNLNYIVLTTVDRDDLQDGGAAHIAKTIRYAKETCPQTMIECLVGDFRGDHMGVKTVVDAKPEVFAHNIETVERLTPTVRDRKAGYDQSLKVLKAAKSFSDQIYTKSSIMLGLGETLDELKQAFADLRTHQVDFLTLGQYLQPSKKHLAVERFVHPDEFKELQALAMTYGFIYVASGPLVRSSYKAAEFFIESHIKSKQAHGKNLNKNPNPVDIKAEQYKSLPVIQQV
ncbi:MAG TPA: lipoyl synthase [Oligoflexia bacterium]|nr:lipoyl synthase [Oligoflexia bacterium]HMR23973.1 lipoyl synthase [Oligoflexia bacterium]